jgi:hypothetical protein
LEPQDGIALKCSIPIILTLITACSSEQRASNRGKFMLGTKTDANGAEQGQAEPISTNSATPGVDVSPGSQDPVLSVDDIFLYFADDRKGSIDTALKDISSDELRVAIDERLDDSGLVEKLVPAYMAIADTDQSGDLSFAEFLDAGIEKDGQEGIVRGIIEEDKRTVFSFIDMTAPTGALGTEDLLRLVKVRVWRLRNWANTIGAGDPTRLKLLAKTGYADLIALVGKTYSTGVLSDEQFQKLSAAIDQKLK